MRYEYECVGCKHLRVVRRPIEERDSPLYCWEDCGSEYGRWPMKRIVFQPTPHIIR